MADERYRTWPAGTAHIAALSLFLGSCVGTTGPACADDASVLLWSSQGETSSYEIHFEAPIADISCEVIVPGSQGFGREVPPTDNCRAGTTAGNDVEVIVTYHDPDREDCDPDAMPGDPLRCYEGEARTELFIGSGRDSVSMILSRGSDTWQVDVPMECGAEDILLDLAQP